MSAVCFTVFGTPQPAGSKKGFVNPKTGKVIITDDAKKSRPWKTDVAQAAGVAMDGRALKRGPLSAQFVFLRKRPQSHLNKAGEVRAGADRYPTTKPDLLKLTRAAEDAMQGIVYANDSQIVRSVLVKEYGEPECVRILVVDL